ncbi:MAG: ATP-binding cassette domain-containing protein [Actinomycetota bacterium]|nr:ATP-binding cassette domain-containing protein [Actinomycetota bacterium]
MAIEVSNAVFFYPDGSPVIDELSFRVPTGSVTALVGPNGVGKTTILNLIAGDLDLFEGSIRSDTEIGYMRQNPGFDDELSATVLDALALSLPGNLKVIHAKLRVLYQRLADHEDVGAELGTTLELWQQLGGYKEEAGWDQITSAVLGQRVAAAGERLLREVSGGERKAIILRAYLLSSVPTLVLDEPDNFLDLFSKDWLEGELKRTSKTVLMVSHDRALLSTAVDRMVVLEHSGSWTHEGNYRTFRKARRVRAERLAKDLTAWDNEERRLYKYYRLMKARAASSSANASRANAAETRWNRFRDDGPPEPPPPEREITTQFRGSRAGKEAVRITNFEVPDLILPFDLLIYHEDRVALLGENGVGKSTLLRKLVEEAEGRSVNDPPDPPVKFGPNAVVGYFSQENTLPDESGNLITIMSRHFPNDQVSRNALGRYGLAKHDRHKYSQLSGGQRARVQLIIMETLQPNVLFLDEPTDNLDLESILVIERSLLDLKATQVAITHDREFTRIFDRWIVFDKDGLVGEVLDRNLAVEMVSGRRFSLLDTEGVKLLTRY